MWIPAQTTTPPGLTARSAAGTSAPTGAKISAASSGAGAAPRRRPPTPRPSEPASACGAGVLRPREREDPPPLGTATWPMMWAAAPNP